MMEAIDVGNRAANRSRASKIRFTDSRSSRSIHRGERTNKRRSVPSSSVPVARWGRYRHATTNVADGKVVASDINPQADGGFSVARSLSTRFARASVRRRHQGGRGIMHRSTRGGLPLAHRNHGAAAAIVALVHLATSACADSPSTPPAVTSSSTTFTFDFTKGVQGWQGGFADYPEGADAFYELVADYRALPAGLPASGSAVYISGNNHSDDLFMFYKRRVAGLSPAGNYHVAIDVEFATSVPHGCTGIGASPGESVYLKGGASTNEPIAVRGADNALVLDIDKGNQSQSGANAVVLGTIDDTLPCRPENIGRWQLKTLRMASPLPVTADGEGGAWLIIGTDSGFEGVTSLFYTRVIASFE
jgi:hypothetical protein